VVFCGYLSLLSDAVWTSQSRVSAPVNGRHAAQQQAVDATGGIKFELLCINKVCLVNTVKQL
jgi:hypothetical protein